jgi:membrane-associated phospholipid phosphatase
MTVSLGYKLKIFFLYIAIYHVFYVLPNLFPLSPPSFLHFFDFEKSIPLVPWSFLVYLSIYVNIVLTIYLMNEIEIFHSYARAVLILFTVCGSFFLIFPTAYPRPPYPSVQNWLVSFGMNLVGKGDSPNNCFPSLHISYALVNWWWMRKLLPKYGLLFFCWALAIMITTLTTKQHYFVDVIGGTLVFLFVRFLDAAIFGDQDAFVTSQ